MLKLNIISIKNKMKFYFLVFLLVNTAIWGEKPDFSCKDGRCSIHFDEIIDTLYADSGNVYFLSQIPLNYTRVQ